MAEQEQGSKTPSWWRRFRWLYAARCTLACVVTVVVVVVTVGGLRVILNRQKELQLKLAGGGVAVDYIQSLPPPGNKVRLKFVLMANNPSGRATMKYANITVRLTDASPWSSSSAAPAATIAEFALQNPIDVAQQTMSEVSVPFSLVPEEDLPMRYVWALYERRGVAGAGMEISGVLSTDGEVAINPINTTYYCWPVTIAVAGDSAADVPCFDRLDAPVL